MKIPRFKNLRRRVMNSDKMKSIGRLVGNTPLLEISLKFKGREMALFAKWEVFNLSGSIKDRMALHILETAFKDGSLRSGAPIIEATSGNTGIAFSAIGKALGHPVVIFMPDWMSVERVNLMKSYGAEVRLVSKEDGGFLGSIEQANLLAKECGGFRPHQFQNTANCEAHSLSTGPEIASQLEKSGKVVGGFTAGVGTGGTVMGVGRFLKKNVSDVIVSPMEPSNSPTLSTGHKVGKHRIQGISDDFIPQICQLDQLDEILSVDDGDAILMAQKLTSVLGLGVGISSGANFLSALSLRERNPERFQSSEQVSVTVFSDDNKKYLSTDLMKEEPVKENFLTPDIELLGYEVLF